MCEPSLLKEIARPFFTLVVPCFAKEAEGSRPHMFPVANELRLESPEQQGTFVLYMCRTGVSMFR